MDVPDPADPDAEPYNPYRFNNRRWDQASGNVDMGFRDYDPGVNRFLTRDAYNGALADLNLTTDPWTGNRYAFAGGNPVTRVELDGHAVTECSGTRPDGKPCATAIDGDISGTTAAQAAAESAADDRFAGRYSAASSSDSALIAEARRRYMYHSQIAYAQDCIRHQTACQFETGMVAFAAAIVEALEEFTELQPEKCRVPEPDPD